MLPGGGKSTSSARKDSRAAMQQGYAVTQGKVYVIMNYEFLKMQAYRGTGGQRDSIPRVTDSVRKSRRREVPDAGICLKPCPEK
jgi:hypothetical protein